MPTVVRKVMAQVHAKKRDHLLKKAEDLRGKAIQNIRKDPGSDKVKDQILKRSQVKMRADKQDAKAKELDPRKRYGEVLQLTRIDF